MQKSEKKFHFKSLKINIHPEVYDPAEDTFLMIESISIHPNNLILEIGSGTGIISLFCAKLGANVICTDINPYAIELIKKNIVENKEKLKGKIEIRKGDLFEPIKKNEKFDIIIFNPPYLPTKNNDKIGGSGWYDKALDGGKSGLKVTIPFLKKVKNYLKKNGKAYFIFTSLSNKKMLDKIINNYSLKISIEKTINFGDEILNIIKIY